MSKKIYIFIMIFMFSFSVLSLKSSGVEAADDRVVYLSGTEYDYPPFSVTDSGEADGFSVDLLKAVAQEMGIVVTFKIDQWATLKEELKNGDLDILPLVGFTEERDLDYDFTVPYIVMRGNIFVRKGEEIILSQDDLFGKEVLVLDGDNSQEWAWSIGLDTELTATTTYTEAFELLSSGQYDAVLAQGLVGEKIIHDEGIDNVVPVYIYDDSGLTRIKLNLEGYEQKFCFAVTEGDSELLSILNEGLAIVSVNGTYDELFQKWFPFLIKKEEMSLLETIQYIAVILVPIMAILITSYIIVIRRVIEVKTSQIEKNSSRNKIIIEAFQKEFSSSEERYDYVLKELLIISESESGFIFTKTSQGKIEFRAFRSILPDYKCDYILLNDIIEKNQLIAKAMASKEPTLSNDYLKEYPDDELFICDNSVFRALILSLSSSENLDVVVLFNKKTPFSENNINQTRILKRGLWSMLEKAEQSERVEYMSFHDTLTGLYNRRFFEEQMEILDNPRNYPITIAIGDVNGLKTVNDTYGHTEGDKLLKNVGELLIKHSRSNDVVTRWGGDEFVIIMPKTSLENSENLFKRIQKDAKSMTHIYGLTSISFGLATKKSSDQELSMIFRDAEEKMYLNKAEMASTTKIGI